MREIDELVKNLQDRAYSKKLSQAEIIRQSNLSRSTVSRTLTQSLTPSLENLFKLCKGLGVRLGEVLPTDHKPPNNSYTIRGDKAPQQASEPQGTYVTKETHARLLLKLKRLERQIGYMEKELDLQEKEILRLRSELGE